MVQSSTLEYTHTEVSETGEKTITLLEPSHMSRDNIQDITFKFRTPVDITSKLDSQPDKGKIATGKNKGRVAYGRCEVHYPDKTYSNVVYLSDCIIQYRKKGDTYGITYIHVGVPIDYIEKLKSDALSNGGIRADLRHGTKTNEKHYWIDMDMRNLTMQNTFVYLRANPDDEDVTPENISLKVILDASKKNCLADLVCSISVSQATTSKDIYPDIENGKYNIGFKPMEVYVHGDTSIDAPPLDFIVDSQRRETANPTSRVIASGELAEKLLAKLNLKK